MTFKEKIDYALLGLYKQTKDGTMLKIKQAFESNNQELSIDELRQIKDIIESKGFAVFQIEPKGLDFRGQITDKGITFVETDSFSNQGTSIINLEQR